MAQIGSKYHYDIAGPQPPDALGVAELVLDVDAVVCERKILPRRRYRAPDPVVFRITNRDWTRLWGFDLGGSGCWVGFVAMVSDAVILQ